MDGGVEQIMLGWDCRFSLNLLLELFFFFACSGVKRILFTLFSGGKKKEDLSYHGTWYMFSSRHLSCQCANSLGYEGSAFLISTYMYMYVQYLPVLAELGDSLLILVTIFLRFL